MRWEGFHNKVRHQPVIEVDSLVRDDPVIRVQISRWLSRKKLIRLKRGVYLLKEQYRDIEVYEPFLAGILKKPSYISLEKALEYHNLIPEGVAVFTSVTTKRQARFSSEMGIFDYRHIKPSLFWGYKSISLRGQTGFLATPEKGILDFFYLRAPRVSSDFLAGLRLQNTERLSRKKLRECAKLFGKKYIVQATEELIKYINKNS
jgi:predicted transcriptional regulator of viral defense system